MDERMIPVWNNTITDADVQCFIKAVRDKNIMEGSVLEEFQNQIAKLLGVSYVLGTASGTAALTLALMSVGVGPGDEVIVPNITFVATANAAKILGAKVVLVDVERERPLLDWDCVRRSITPRTKAVMCVDLNGRIACHKAIWEELRQRGIYLISDSCQAFMSRNESGYAGTACDIGCFSFGITKTVSTIQGGAVVTNDGNLYEKMRFMKRQGVRDVFFSAEYLMPGFNFKLPDTLASIGLGQLERLPEKIRHMKTIHRMYEEAFQEVEKVKFIKTDEDEFLWMNDILVEDRKAVMDHMSQQGITTRPIGAALSTANYFSLSSAGKKNTDYFSSRILYLPSGPDQDFHNVEVAIQGIKTCLM